MVECKLTQCFFTDKHDLNGRSQNGHKYGLSVHC